MILTLEVTGSRSDPPLRVERQSFRRDGGTIGRDGGSSWVLPDGKVSALHAVITFKNHSFFIEDRSRNGVSLIPEQGGSVVRLEKGRPYPLNSGDRLLIDPYEIEVSIDGDIREPTVAQPASGGFNELSAFLATPKQDAPRAAARDAEPWTYRTEEPVAASRKESLNPVELLFGDEPSPPSPRRAERPREADPFGVLVEIPEPEPVRRDAPTFDGIPEGYNPLNDVHERVDRPPAPRPSPGDSRERVRPRPGVPAPAPAEHRAIPPPMPERGQASPSAPPPGAQTDTTAGAADLAAVLAGCGLDPSLATSALAHDLGRILQVVVAGVMDILESRQKIKRELGMVHTMIQRADNNPLKLSANVGDALHNLLVKRNPAYLGPVEAFEEAFVDLRDHQMAMLEGIRSAFDAMLGEFDPDSLQKEFELHAKGFVPAKLRYWDLYREHLQALAKDRDGTFRKLFGEEFTHAYEEHLRLLKARRVDTDATGTFQGPVTGGEKSGNVSQ